MTTKKYIVMLQGIGNNESAWAKIISRQGKVFLIQRGVMEHIEIWEWGKCIFLGPYNKLKKTRIINAILYDPYTILRMIYLTLRFSRGISNLDLIIATSNYYGMAGLLLKKFGKVRKMVSLLQDYFPIDGSVPVKIYRSFHYCSSRFVAKRADQVWQVSPRIKTGLVNPCNYVIPIHINMNKIISGNRSEIAYFGYPTPDHALKHLFKVCKEHNIVLNIIGDSPYLSEIKKYSPDNTIFHGFLNDGRITQILQKCFCGYAVYLNVGPDNHSYYGIPSKMFRYFASGVPVVTTDIAHFSAKIPKYGLGELITPTYDEIEKAILKIRNNYTIYYDSILNFRSHWNKNVETFLSENLKTLL